MLRFENYYVNKRTFGIYSGGSIGYLKLDFTGHVTPTNASQAPPSFSIGLPVAVQFTGIGIRGHAPGSNLNLFGELGYGFNGILSLGMVYTIHAHK